MKIEYAMQSRSGDRPYNEDSILMQERSGRWLFLLADGLGGCGHGELASGTAVNSVAGLFGWNGEGPDFPERAMETAQKAVLQKQEDVPEASAMSTTLVVLKLEDYTASWAHIGDSRLYYFRGGKIQSQTIDHSVPQMLVNLGEITFDQIRSHPDRNRLLRTIGRPWSERSYDVADPVQLKAGDAFLLASDGFWEYIEEKQMCDLLVRSASPARWLKEMNALVEKNGRGSNMDNYSAVCVFVQ